MSVNRNSSIYILVGLLIIVGILIFAFRVNLLNYVSNQVFGSDNLLKDSTLVPSASANIDIKVLERSDFKKLSDKVPYFDFNVVGKPVLKNSNVTAPNWPVAYKGNFNPFFIKKVESNELSPQ
jgi:hypothetical protein